MDPNELITLFAALLLTVLVIMAALLEYRRHKRHTTVNSVVFGAVDGLFYPGVLNKSTLGEIQRSHALSARA